MPKKVDYTGKRIGRVKVIKEIGKKFGTYEWECKCDCGQIFYCISKRFSKGERFECNRCIFDRRRGPDLTGRVFGRWTVTGASTVDCRNKTVYPCKCDCGSFGFISWANLRHPKKSKSCGCWGRKIKSKYVNTTLYPPSHGISHTNFYKIRTSLIHKCYKENNCSYKNFGAKGITVCDLWRNGAKDMYAWAISNGWRESDVLCLKDGAKEFNPETTYIIPYNDLRSQIGFRGGLQVTYNGETHSIKKWAEILDVNASQLRSKIKKNPSIEEVFGSKFKKMKFFRDPSLIKQAIDLYLSGENISKIGKKLGSCPTNIRYHLIKNNIELRKEFPLKKPEIKNEQISKMIQEGLNAYQISKKLGISNPSVYNRIKKIKGIKRDRSKG